MKEIVDLYGEMLSDVILTMAVVGLLFYAVWGSEWMQQLLHNTLTAAC